MIRKSEIFNALTHGAGAIGGAVVTALFLALSIDLDSTLAAAVCVTGMSHTLLYTASFIYHAGKEDCEAEESTWLKLDHCAIFIMMAGSYVGPMYIYGSGGILWSVLGAVWLFALLGIVLKLRFLLAPNWVNAVIYAPLALMSFIPISLLWSSMDSVPASVPMAFMKSLLLGGLGVYAAAGIVYALKKPDPRPELIGFHGVFHVLALAGAGLHAAALYFSIKYYPLISESLARTGG
jgi:hemolysin III